MIVMFFLYGMSISLLDPFQLFASVTTFVVAAVSLLGVPSVLAVEESNVPTYSWLEKEGNQLQERQKSLIHESEGWINETFDAQTGAVEKLKLVKCQQGRCIYYRQISTFDGKHKFLSVAMIDCLSKRRSHKELGKWVMSYPVDVHRSDSYKAFCK